MEFEGLEVEDLIGESERARRRRREGILVGEHDPLSGGFHEEEEEEEVLSSSSSRLRPVFPIRDKLIAGEVRYFAAPLVRWSK